MSLGDCQLRSTTEQLKRIFITADPHFGERKLATNTRKFCSSDDMDNFIKSQWNNTINNGQVDYLIVAGDIGDCTKIKTLEERKMLNNPKTIFVMGNHEKNSSPPYYEKFFDYVCPNFCSIALMYNDNKEILVTHEPSPAALKVSTAQGYQVKQPQRFNVHGHLHRYDTHDNLIQISTNNSVCVCVDFWNYAPVNLYDLSREVCFLL